MTKFKKLTAVVCTAILLSGLAGCSDAVAKLKDSNEVLFSVGKKNITKGDVFTLMKQNAGATTTVNEASKAIAVAEIEVTEKMEKEAQASLANYKSMYGDKFASYLKNNNLDEDSYLKGLINLDDIKNQLEKFDEKKDWACYDCFNRFLKDIKNVNTQSERPSVVYSWVTQLKIQLIYSATWSFVKNYNEIMKGKFTIELLKDPDCFNKSTLEVLKNLMNDKVYSSGEIKHQNVQAKKILETIWFHLTKFIKHGTIEDFEDESFNQLPLHLQETLEKLKDRIEDQHNSFLYDELRLIIDFICFLSDDDAEHLAGYYAGFYNSSDTIITKFWDNVR